jgi:hypothetical protein
MSHYFCNAGDVSVGGMPLKWQAQLGHLNNKYSHRSWSDSSQKSLIKDGDRQVNHNDDDSDTGTEWTKGPSGLGVSQ